MRRLTKADIQARIDETLALNKSDSIVKITGKYEGANIPVAMKCSKHGKFMKAVGEMRVKKNFLVCPDCSREAVAQERIEKSKVTYQKDLDKLFNGTIKLVGTYVCRHTKTWHKCTVCGHKALVLPHSKLRGHGCTVCASVRRQSERGSTVKVKGVEHRVEGYEGRALTYLTNALGLKSKDILALSTGKVPSIAYTHENKENGKGVYTHYYHPDFYVAKTKTFYEVKSTMTLGLFVPEVYNKNRSKARGCVEQGYNHVLVLVLRDGETIAIEKWYKKSRKSLIKYLYEDCLVSRLQ